VSKRSERSWSSNNTARTPTDSKGQQPQSTLPYGRLFRRCHDLSRAKKPKTASRINAKSYVVTQRTARMTRVSHVPKKKRGKKRVETDEQPAHTSDMRNIRGKETVAPPQNFKRIVIKKKKRRKTAGGNPGEKTGHRAWGGGEGVTLPISEGVRCRPSDV